jgi:hypothetical protein
VIWAEVSCEVSDEDSEMVAEVFRMAGAGGVAFTGPSLITDSMAVAEGSEAALYPEGACFGGPTRVIAYFPVDDLLERRIGTHKEVP